jgi:hypothetical protein
MEGDIVGKSWKLLSVNIVLCFDFGSAKLLEIQIIDVYRPKA